MASPDYIATHGKPTHPSELKSHQCINQTGLESWAMEADYYQESAYEIIKHYPDFDYQAIFCGSDMMAIGAMKALLEKGVKIPQEVALAGFDNIPNSDFLPISLTTVDTPIEQLGTKAVEMLIGLIKGNCETRTIKLDANVLVRQST